MADPLFTFVFHNPEGSPVYRADDVESGASYLVVVMPDGQTYYADRNGRPARPQKSGTTGTGAFVGGIIGLMFGGPAALLGIAAGALLGSANEKTVQPHDQARDAAVQRRRLEQGQRGRRRYR